MPMLPVTVLPVLDGPQCLAGGLEESHSHIAPLHMDICTIHPHDEKKHHKKSQDQDLSQHIPAC
jgi:hypothetical protein